MEEQIRILKMVEEGKITAEQAAKLLEALGVEGNRKPEEDTYEGIVASTQVLDISQKDYDKKMFRIQVDSSEGDKVNIQLPVKAIKKLLKVTGKIPMPNDELQGIDLEEITSAVIECLDSQVMGDIVNVTASDGTTVRIFID